MRITVSQRPNANSVNTHHCLWRRKDWLHESLAHRQARIHSGYQFEIERRWHDLLHRTIEPLQPPHIKVARAMVDIMEPITWKAPDQRIEHALDGMAGWARTQPSPELADGMRETMTHLSAQLGILALYRSLR